MAIHQNIQLSNVEALNYLTSFLKAPDLKCIQGFALT